MEELPGSNGQEPTLLLPGDRNDSNVRILVPEDKLEIRADFYPPLAGSKPLDANSIAAALARFNVVHGVLWENIVHALTECNLERRFVRNIPIARGDPPVKEILEYYQLNPALNRNETARGDSSRIDHRSYSPFVIVKKGQALAKLKSRREGKDGRDVYGTVIPHGTIRPEGVVGGANTRKEGKYIYAEINGQLIRDKNTLNIQDSLVIKGPVDYRTGHIMFPGDVFIEGPVSDGFKIYSGSSVTIKQTFDVTDAVTKKDLVVSGGLIGRGRALVKVGGALKTRFIENCKVACRKTIEVDTDIVNSSVYTMEKLVMSDQGKILGGEIYAVQGVHAGGIGKKTGRETRIHCGVDFTAQQEKEWYNYQLRIVAAKLHKLRELLAAESGGPDESAAGAAGNPGAPGTERREKMEETLARLEEEQKKITLQASAVLARLNADENAVVEVPGEIASGTLIEICQVAFFVSDPLKHVRVRLDRKLGKLTTEPL
ncbi:MAG: FapA family protein [Treponema sp.]|jgi:uncharacterized protein (DUF342 family)|nr:FapA family protein [Treponema sp.]